MTSLSYSQIGLPRLSLLNNDTVVIISVSQMKYLNLMQFDYNYCKENTKLLTQQIANYQLSLSNYQSQVTDYKKQINLYGSRLTDANTTINNLGNTLKQKDKALHKLNNKYEAAIAIGFVLIVGTVVGFSIHNQH